MQQSSVQNQTLQFDDKSEQSGETDDDSASSHRNLREAMPPPVVTYLLLLIMGAIFTAMFIAGRGDVNRVAEEFGAKDNALIRAGQYWRFVTPIFLHGGWLHLAVNGLSLLWLGAQMERLYGARKYLIIFLVAGIMGNVFSFWRSDADSLGASGALFGLVGAGLVFPVRFHRLVAPAARREILRQLGTVALVNFAIGRSIPGIDNWAHLGGMLGGGAAALLLIPQVLMEARPRGISSALLSATTAAALLIIGWAATAQWQWVRHDLSDQHVVTVGPPGSDPWWTIGVPDSWKPRDGHWYGVNGAFAAGWRDNETGGLITVTEAPLNMAWLVQRMAKAVRGGAKLRPSQVDGKEAVQFQTSDTHDVLSVYEIPVYDHLISVAFKSPRATYAVMEPQLDAFIQRLRIVHPPTGWAPAPPAAGNFSDLPERLMN